MKCDFCGDYIFTQSELENINEEVRLLLRHSDYHGNADAKLFVAFVNAVKVRDSEDESRLYDYLGKIFGVESSQKMYGYVKCVIGNLEKAGRLIVFNEYRKKYYATLMCHALAPKKSLNALLELCWAVYCKDFSKQAVPWEAIVLITDLLASRFSAQMTKDEAEIELGSKTYSLLIGVRAPALYRKEMMYKLLDRIFRTMDDLFHEREVNTEGNISQLIIKWWEDKASEFGIESPRPEESGRHASFTSIRQIQLSYVVRDAGIAIKISSFLIDDDADILVTIRSEGNSQDYYVFTQTDRIFLKVTEETYLPCPEEGLNSVSVVIKQGGKILYQSGDSLKRKFIIFKEANEVTSDICKPGVYQLYVPKFNMLKVARQDNLSRCKGKLFYYQAEEGDKISYEERIIFFETVKKERPLTVFDDDKVDIVFRAEGCEYKVIDGDLFVGLKPELNPEDYGVRYEDASFKLTDFPLAENVLEQKFRITELLMPGETQRITIFKFVDNEIIETVNIVKFNSIKLNYDREIYYGNELFGCVTFSAEGFDEVSVTFSAEDDEILLHTANGDIVVRPPVFAWAIDDKMQPHFYPQRALWYDDITNSSKFFPLFISGLSGSLLLDDSPVPGDCFSGFKLGQLVHSLQSTREKPATLTFNLVLPSGEEKSFDITKVYFHEEFLQDPIAILSQSSMIWNPKECFVGSSNPRPSFRLVIFFDGQEYLNCKLGIERKNLRPELEEGCYDIQIKLITCSVFGSNERIIFKKRKIFGSEKKFRFQGKRLKISHAILDGRYAMKKLSNTYYIRNIKFLKTDDDGFDYFSGNLVMRGKYIDSLPDDNEEYEKVNPIRIVVLTSRSCELGYGLDKKGQITAQFTFDTENNLISIMDKFNNSVNHFIFAEEEDV